MLIGLFNQDIGLSQSIALPKDSYLQDYFDDMNTYLHTGPPVYFVIKDGYNYSNGSNQNKVSFDYNCLLFCYLFYCVQICSSAGCNNNSIGTQISSAALISD